MHFGGESGAGQIKQGLQAANHQPCGRRGQDAQTKHEFDEQVKLGQGDQKFGGFWSQPGLKYDDHSTDSLHSIIVKVAFVR